MKHLVFFLGLVVAVQSAEAGWWFSSDEDEEPRLSELMETASLCIDEASDLASEGKTQEAVMKYREALREIDNIRQTHPDKLDSPEFASLKTKQAFITAAIDSLFLSEARANVNVVSTCDTTELEKRLAREKGEALDDEASARDAAKVEQKVVQTPPAPTTPRERAMLAIQTKDFAAADMVIGEMLKSNPKSAVALNLRAALETAQGRFKAAERTLDEAIESNPRDYFAYYNMAALYLQIRQHDKSAARRYYETGRVLGGPQDPELEGALK